MFLSLLIYELSDNFLALLQCVLVLFEQAHFSLVRIKNGQYIGVDFLASQD